MAPSDLPAGYRYTGGVLDSLKGNQMPNTPKWTVSLGVQYTFHLGGDYSLVPRFDYYWNDKAFGTIFNDGADRMKAYDVMNAQIQLNAPDDFWYARAWVQNLQNKTNVTGMYATDPVVGPVHQPLRWRSAHLRHNARRALLRAASREKRKAPGNRRLSSLCGMPVGAKLGAIANAGDMPCRYAISENRDFAFR